MWWDDAPIAVLSLLSGADHAQVALLSTVGISLCNCRIRRLSLPHLKAADIFVAFALLLGGSIGLILHIFSDMFLATLIYQAEHCIAMDSGKCDPCWDDTGRNSR